MGPRELVKHHEEAEVCQECKCVCVFSQFNLLGGRRVLYCQRNRAYNENVGDAQKKLCKYKFCTVHSIRMLCGNVLSFINFSYNLYVKTVIKFHEGTSGVSFKYASKIYYQ